MYIQAADYNIYYYIQMSYTHYTAAARAGEPAATSRQRVDRSSAHYAF